MDGHSKPHRPTTGKVGGRSTFRYQQLVLLSLGLLNALLLIAAVVVGIYCAKDQENNLQPPDSAISQLIAEMNFLRDTSSIVKEKLEAQAALERERASHLLLTQEVKQKKAVTDNLQGQIEELRTTIINLHLNKTALVESCGRCLPGWSFVNSTCYYFSMVNDDSMPKKNWVDSRQHCTSQGGELLVIDSLEERKLIVEYLPRRSIFGNSQDWFWVGLTHRVTDRTWVWLNNMTNVFTMNVESQRFENGGHCARISGRDQGRMAHADCNQSLYNWICEMDPS